MVGIAGMIAVAVGGWLWIESSDYKVLFSNLSDKDGGAIVAVLTQMNVPYKFTEGGAAILVPADKVHDTRLRLASQGLPKGGTVGFELVDNQKFGATQFQEQINYQRGLEGELAKSIQSLSVVQAARVHLAIPKPTVFLREQQGPSASVLLTLYPGKTLDRAQVNGIVYLVASSVPSLAPANVSVLDQTGALLSKNGDADNNGLDATQLSYVKDIEQSTIRRIQDILEPILGPNNARVQVSADIDFSRTEAMSETFKPNGDAAAATIRNQQLNEAMTTSTTAQGVPGALSNQPPGNASAPIDGKVGTSSQPPAVPVNTRKDQSTNYEVDKTIQHTRAPVGSIKRITAAVVLNNRIKVDENGKTTSVPLTPQEIEQINALVREAMGFNKARGDSLNVVNTAFNPVEREVIPEIAWWKQRDNIAMAKEIGRYALFAVLLAYLFFAVLRPSLKKVFKTDPPPAEVEALESQSATAEEAAAEGELVVAGEDGEEIPALPPAEETPPDPLQLAKQIAREDPRKVANIVKSWVNQDE
jgi:flagellar M-ring protein FliF